MLKCCSVRNALLVLGCLLTSLAHANSTIGQPAPPLDGGKWIKGDPVQGFRPGKVYVVSFWFSPDAERPAALKTIENMCRAHDKDLVAICVSADGKEDDSFDDLLKRQDVAANLRVLKDDPGEAPGPVVVRWLSGLTTESAYPLTFVVDKRGKVAYVGDVLEAAEILPAVISGERTGETAAKDAEETANEYAKVQAEIATRPQQRAALGDNVGAAEAIDPIIAKYPHSRQQLLFQKFFYLLQAKKYELAYKLADDIAQTSRFDPNSLNELAWFMVDEDWIETRDLDRALKFSERSNELSGNRVAAFLDTLARVYYEQGDIEKAYDLQKKAVAISRESERPQLQGTLDRYRAAIPK